MPKSRTACAAYREQVGSYLQWRGVSGDIVRWYAAIVPRMAAPQRPHRVVLPSRRPDLARSSSTARWMPSQALGLGKLARRRWRPRQHRIPAHPVGLILAERLSQQPLDTIALDRAADPPANRQAEPRSVAVRAGKRVEHEVPVGHRAALAVNAVELGAA